MTQIMTASAEPGQIASLIQSAFGDIEAIIEKLRAELPFLFTRKEIVRHLGGVIAEGTLANLAVMKKGPPSFRSRRHVVYERDKFLKWFADWSKPKPLQ